MDFGGRRRWGVRLSGAGRAPFPCRSLGALLLARLLPGQRPAAGPWLGAVYFILAASARLPAWGARIYSRGLPAPRSTEPSPCGRALWEVFPSAPGGFGCPRDADALRSPAEVGGCPSPGAACPGLPRQREGPGGDAALPSSLQPGPSERREMLACSWGGGGMDGGLRRVGIISLLLPPGRGAVLGQMVFLSDLVALSDSLGC